MAGQRSAALLIVHDGKLRLERYGLGFDAAGRWTSSVAKSLTSTLVGAGRCATASSRAWTTRSAPTSRR
ncbi:MAG: hypothetical protein U1F67_14860 [Rubrivivax sp.]